MGTTNHTLVVFRQGVLAVLVAALGWATVASMMVAQDHGIVSASMLIPAGLSVGIVGAFLAAPAVTQRQRRRASGACEPSHIHVPRPPREYFSPYACCPPDNERKR